MACFPLSVNELVFGRRCNLLFVEISNFRPYVNVFGSFPLNHVVPLPKNLRLMISHNCQQSVLPITPEKLCLVKFAIPLSPSKNQVVL